MSESSRKNSFDIVRFLAATLVILSHSYALMGHKEPHIGNATLGGFSVWVFFILSGYLIAFSWKQYPRFNVFMAKRALRIFPALIVATLVTVVFMGFLSTLPYRTYITHPLTLSYLNNIFLFNTQYALPGVFANNPYPSAVNGSIWTLAYEFTMYGAVAALGALSLLRKKRVEIFWLFLLGLCIVSVFKPKALSFLVFYLDFGLVAQMGLLFFSGVLLQVYERVLSYKALFWIGALLAFFVSATLLPALTPILGATLLAYGILGFSKLPYFSGFGRYGDFSYGLYVYAFPVQQTLIHFTGSSNLHKIFVVSFFVTFVLSVASWHFVESRFIKMKKRIRHEDYPLSERHEDLAHAW